MSNDRTVHGVTADMEAVRYDSSGKWYMEPTDPALPRQLVTVAQAAASIDKAWTDGSGAPCFDRPGGRAFDRMLRAL